MHPILEQMVLSEEQWSPVLARGKDVVVTAGAGTGKTHTLVARYLSLLADGLPLRSIVAITFTRKAGREMRNRIREKIRCYISNYISKLSDEEEHRRWEGLYAALDAARIGTIHSLCAEILRAHPAEAEVDPHFKVLEEGETALLRRRAVSDAMAWAASEQDVVPLFSLLGEEGLRKTLEALLERRLEVGEAFSELSKPSPEEIVSFWREKAKCLIPRSVRGFVDDSRDDFANLRALQADGTLERAKSVGDALVEDLQKLLQIWEQIECAAKEEDWFTVLSHFGPLRKHMKQKGRTENWKPANPKETIKRLQQRYDETLGSLFGDEGKINKDLDLKMAEILLVLSRLFDFACKQYRAMKEERNGLDYDDLEEKALALLRRRPDIQKQWQQEIRAVLVDEFQDTNGRQRDLVRLLSGDGGKLFLVGDAKQSIYRFRGADVTVFRQERERIGNIYPLEITYRAHQGLVEGLNALLRPVLGDTEDCQKPWREPFAPIKAYRAEPRPGFTSPYIELHLAVGSKKEGALDRAADALAVRLRELVEEKQVQTGKGNRNSSPISYSDVAILCRASTSFKAYEDALERAGIPYLTVAGRGFYDRPEIRDLLNALQALANPTDDLALTGLLRSPAFGLSDAALYLLRKSKRTTTLSIKKV
jgi:ATP-dependent helicase/nuclease subunit A